MCLDPKELKFCTCTIAPDSETNNLWVLHRFNPDKHECIMGETQIPGEWLDPEFKVNEQKIASRLNEVDAFDKPMEFIRDDKLVVHLDGEKAALTYCFRYGDGRWTPEEFCPFELYNRYEEFGEGPISQTET